MRQCRLQLGATHARLEPRAQRLDGVNGAGNGLAIARVGHAFAASDMLALADLDEDDIGRRLAAPRDGEAAGDRPAFGVDREPAHHIRASASTIFPTPVRKGSTVGRPYCCSVSLIARAAAASSSAEVLRLMATQRTFGLVRRAAARLASMQV